MAKTKSKTKAKRVLPPVEENARAVLQRLLAVRDVDQRQLARLCGLSESSISERLSGVSRLQLTEIFLFAHLFGHEPSIFFMDIEDAEQADLDVRREASRHGRPVFNGDFADQMLEKVVPMRSTTFVHSADTNLSLILKAA